MRHLLLELLGTLLELFTAIDDDGRYVGGWCVLLVHAIYNRGGVLANVLVCGMRGSEE